MPRMHKKVPGTTLHKRPTLRGTNHLNENMLPALICKPTTYLVIIKYNFKITLFHDIEFLVHFLKSYLATTSLKLLFSHSAAVLY